MSTTREGTKKPKTTIEPRVISWEERKTLADKEAEVLEKQIEDLKTWTNMIDAMNEEQLKEYLKNRPDELKTVKIHKSNSKQRVKSHMLFLHFLVYVCFWF
ncbi:hypothetical protein PRUPE_1G031600 [Prunus persica]|uniref:Uncharacterized protein n=1 Tax=Prunus persica TaxID=3760 RepID=A0A251QS07_PRUPE|nr:hypothetical protein PRUPE_1G031600 [Prunus persica]